MCRSFDLRITPSDRRGPDVEIYTYRPDEESLSLVGQVWLELEATGVRGYTRLTPAQARAAAKGLLDAATQAEADGVVAATVYPEKVEAPEGVQP